MNNTKNEEIISEDIYWIASRVFSDIHYGSAITEVELVERLSLEKSYENEISRVKEVILKSKKFEKLSYSEKLSLVAHLLVSFRSFTNTNIPNISKDGITKALTNLSEEELSILQKYYGIEDGTLQIKR